MKNLKFYVIAALGLLLLIIGALISNYEFFQTSLKGLPYGLIGIGCGAFGCGLGQIYQLHYYKKHPQIAKAQEIQCKDERNQSLNNQAKAKAYNIMTYVFGALILVFACIGTSPEIVIPLVIAYLFIHFFMIYERIKIEKTN